MFSSFLLPSILFIELYVVQFFAIVFIVVLSLSIPLVTLLPLIEEIESSGEFVEK